MYNLAPQSVELDKAAFLQAISQKAFPSLPSIQARLLDICADAALDINKISTLIDKDPAFSLQLLNLAGVAEQHDQAALPSIAAAIQNLDNDSIRDMAALSALETAYGYPAESTRELNKFWMHSLKCAVLCERLAMEIQFHDPAGAYLTGMLHDIGSLALATCFPDQFSLFADSGAANSDKAKSEYNRTGMDHCQAGGWLVHRYTGCSFMADAIRYHHSSRERIAQAFPLVQIVYVANLLAQRDKHLLDSGYAAAETILGLAAAQTEELVVYASIETDTASQELNVQGAKPNRTKTAQPPDPAPTPPLADLLKGDAQASLLARRLLKAEDNGTLFQYAARGMKLLFSLNDVYFFFHDAERDALVGQPIKDNARSTALTRLHIPMKLKNSLPVSSLLKNKITDSFTLPQGTELSLMENQLLHFLGAKGMLCLPLATGQKALGIILAGVDREHYEHLKHHTRLLQMISREVSTALLSHHHRQKNLEKKYTAAMQAQKQLTRKTVHEVNNPLGAIKNYLRVLELKLSRDGIVLDEVRIIEDEINRVIRIINTLTGIEKPDHVTPAPADLNAILLDTASLYKDTLQQRGIEVQLDLDDTVPPTVLNKDHLKQVFMNLVKNAMEALEGGGTIHLKTSYAKASSRADSDTVLKDIQGHVSILVADDGPGIPDELKKTIFEPQVTAKKRHQGLGLSIVRDLVGRMKGSIDLISNQDYGTCFTIKLPVAQS